MVKYSIFVSEELETDLRQIIDYIKINNRKAAENQFNKFKESISNLETLPNSYPQYNYFRKDLNVRRKIVGKYSIIFMVNEEEKTIYVLRIMNNGQKLY